MEANLKYLVTIDYYQYMLDIVSELYAGKQLTMEEMIRRDTLQEICLQEIDQADRVYKRQELETM